MVCYAVMMMMMTWHFIILLVPYTVLYYTTSSGFLFQVFIYSYINFADQSLGFWGLHRSLMLMTHDMSHLMSHGQNPGQNQGSWSKLCVAVCASEHAGFKSLLGYTIRRVQCLRVRPGVHSGVAPHPTCC